jgi:hypothetical protein
MRTEGNESKTDLIIRQGSMCHKFLYVVHNHRDGSMYFGIKRAKGLSPIEVSYHATGQINYKMDFRSTIVGEPLYSITKPVRFFSVNIPGIKVLPLYEKELPAEDNILNLSPDWTGRILFGFAMYPVSEESPPKDLYFMYGDLYKLVLSFMYPAPSLPEGREKETAIEYIKGGPTRSDVNEDTALIEIHNKINGVEREMILYEPNKEGIWTLIPSRPMGMVPKLLIEFSIPNLRVERIESKKTPKAYIRSRVRDKAGRLVTEPCFRSISLEAEL